MKLRTLVLLAAVFPAFAPAAPARQASKQQCQGYLKDSFEIVTYATVCQPESAEDERYKTAFYGAIEQLNQGGCDNVLSREEAQNFLRRQAEGKEQAQYCATIKDAVPHYLQRYGNR